MQAIKSKNDCLQILFSGRLESKQNNTFWSQQVCTNICCQEISFNSISLDLSHPQNPVGTQCNNNPKHFPWNDGPVPWGALGYLHGFQIKDVVSWRNIGKCWSYITEVKLEVLNYKTACERRKVMTEPSTYEIILNNGMQIDVSHKIFICIFWQRQVKMTLLLGSSAVQSIAQPF